MVYITVKQSPIYHQMTLEELLFGTTKAPVINYNETNTRTYTCERVNQKLLDNTDLFALINSLIHFNEHTASIHNKKREALYETFYQAKKNKGMPYVFKKIFAAQKKYVECDTSKVFRDISTKMHELINQHPTEMDDEITDSVISYCTNVLTDNGFTITKDIFSSIVKDAYRRIDAPKDELKNALYQLKSIFEEDFGALYHTSAFAYINKRSTIDALKRHQSNESKWFGKYDLSNFFGSTTVDEAV